MTSASVAHAAGESATGERSGKLDGQQRRERRRARERDARRLEKLEGRIAEEEARIEALKQSFAAPEVYQDHVRLRALQAEQTRFEAELEALYRDWETLSESLADA